MSKIVNHLNIYNPHLPVRRTLIDYSVGGGDSLAGGSAVGGGCAAGAVPAL